MSTIKDIPVSERPYEKCFSGGPGTLTDRELLSVILRTGTGGMSAYELSGKVLSEISGEENLLSIMHLTKEQLLKIKGIGKVKAVQIMCISELAQRIATRAAKPELKYDNPDTIAEYYMENMRHLEQEVLTALFLDTKCHLIKEKTMSRGTINQSLISPREIFVDCLKCNGVNIILLHNHPSGDCTPSKADISVTKKIMSSAKLLGINLLDHIIIGDRKYLSMREQELL